MPTPATLDELQKSWGAFRESLGFEEIADTLRVRPHAVADGTITLAMPLRDEIAQAAGMYSAAALFGVADITGTFLAILVLAEEGQFPLAVQANINLLTNSRSPEAYATARIVRAGRSVAVAEAHVSDAEGALLASATFTYALRARKVGKP